MRHFGAISFNLPINEFLTEAILEIGIIDICRTRAVRRPTAAALACHFAKTIIEAEEALPWESGDFLAAFDEARQEQIEAAIEGDSLAQALRHLALMQPHWEGHRYNSACSGMVADYRGPSRKASPQEERHPVATSSPLVASTG